MKLFRLIHDFLRLSFSNYILSQKKFIPQKKSRIPFIGFVILFIVIAISLRFFIFPPIQEAALEHPTLINRIKTAPDTTIAGKIIVGESFYLLMQKHEIPIKEALNFYDEFKKIAPANLTAGDSFVITRFKDSILTRFALKTANHVWYEAQLKGQTVHAFRKDPVFTKKVVRLSSKLGTSLYESILSLGEEPELVTEFVDLFSWDINFFLDPREGDPFLMIVEKVYDEQGKWYGYGKILAARYKMEFKTFSAFWFSPDSAFKGYFDQDGRAVQKMFLKAPLHYNRISSKFSFRRYHPVLHVFRKHPAVDYTASIGAPVYAAADGVVEFAGRQGGYGNCICIRHGGSFKTYYGHLSRYASGIRSGKRVYQKDCIGFVGSSGLSSGPHLDYRVEKNGVYINPLTLKSPSSVNIPMSYRTAFEKLKEVRMAELNNSSASIFAEIYKIGKGIK